MSNILEVRDLVKRYEKDVLAVNRISFSVKEGEVFGFLGPNGAGKSTTISMITTLLTPTSGSVTLDGEDVVKNANSVRKTIGLVPQSLTADDELSGRENMRLQADLYGVPRKIAEERINELLGTVKLEEAADRRVDTYSGGMRKRLELAEGLIHRPKMLFLDEPTLGLDIQTREIIWEYIRKMKEESNMTVFLTTHYLEEADALCDRIAIIDEGEIKIIGTPAELKDSLGGDIINAIICEDTDLSGSILEMAGVSSAVREGFGYCIKTKDGERTEKDILAVSVREGWKIESISLHPPSINEVFLKYTGKSLRDEDRGSNRHEIRKQELQNIRRRG
ncbi:MAG: ATP-binding cassette domain-containing protein [Candidatus Methanoplasma sp.]|jgi:ABC-2 type transport system ATP-binding protein|nr:ATP-binding cassette domain-containing protein [Candidatus Methanoplasma sp.]